MSYVSILRELIVQSYASCFIALGQYSFGTTPIMIRKQMKKNDNSEANF